jgi:hypothetical protein
MELLGLGRRFLNWQDMRLQFHRSESDESRRFISNSLQGAGADAPDSN